jgi:hypothetical protein
MVKLKEAISPVEFDTTELDEAYAFYGSQQPNPKQMESTL